MDTGQREVLKLNLVLMSAMLLLKKRRRRHWVRFIFRERNCQGDYHNLLQEMLVGDNEGYFNYLRMSSNTFNTLLSIVGPSIRKIYHVREPISPGERLALTLRYLASGDSMVSMSYSFRIGKSTVSQIIRETCEVLWDCLHEMVLLTPTEDSWLQVAKDFNDKWQLPNCVGAIDGKHVVIQAPPNLGSTYFNYKGMHSIILLALCDANYRFTIVDIGAEGRHSDGGIFRNSYMGKLIINNSIHFPPPSPVEYEGEPLNYYIVGDEAFPLMPQIMRPYPGRFLTQTKKIFNYRLSRGRRVIENSFGILSAKWRIFRKPIIASLQTTRAIVKAAVCLHNFLINLEANVSKESNRYWPNNLIDREDDNGILIQGEWRAGQTSDNLLPVMQLSSNMYSKNAEAVRQQITSYFLFDGAVDFQWDKV